MRVQKHCQRTIFGSHGCQSVPDNSGRSPVIKGAKTSPRLFTEQRICWCERSRTSFASGVGRRAAHFSAAAGE
jgi:hypothetical protein